MKFNGQSLALLSAALFGVSPVLAKSVIGGMSPLLLAGLLYLGSGAGLLLFILIKKKPFFSELAKLSKPHTAQLAAAVACGGVLAPVCLVYGLAKASAFEVSLLLNLETVFATLFAWFIFREHVSGKVWAGKTLLVLGAVLVAVNPEAAGAFSAPALAVILACAFW
ncbi:MAG: DMT family transporter, partial [Elusimicrobiaceae bacterium]